MPDGGERLIKGDAYRVLAHDSNRQPSLWQASSQCLRQARSLGQKAWSRFTGADVARSAVNFSPGARAGCSAPVSGLSVSRAAKGGKVHFCRYSCGPFQETGALFLSALAK